MYPRKRQKSALVYMLKGLLPYSRENLALSFSPNRFFNELEKETGYSRKTFQNTARKAEKIGLIKRDGSLWELTQQGKERVEPFKATKLPHKASLMIIFDIPEQKAFLRRRLRLLLKEWRFVQVQKSVWVSEYDYKKILVKAVDELGLEDCVQIFESARLYPK